MTPFAVSICAGLFAGLLIGEYCAKDDSDDGAFVCLVIYWLVIWVACLLSAKIYLDGCIG